MFQYSYITSIGEITIAEDNACITNVAYHKLNCEIRETSLIKKAYKELSEYLSGHRKSFDIPIKFVGTPFQISVWKALQSIPYGQTASYKDIANLIENPRAYRAVGMANNKNPLAIIVPCHRVVGADGSLTGYAGGIKIKEKLLELEKLYK